MFKLNTDLWIKLRIERESLRSQYVTIENRVVSQKSVGFKSSTD